MSFATLSFEVQVARGAHSRRPRAPRPWVTCPSTAGSRETKAAFLRERDGVLWRRAINRHAVDHLRIGANVSATRQARMRLEKLSITAIEIARVPSSRRMTVVSMCHISYAPVVRRPSWVWPDARAAGSAPAVRTRRYQVEGEAQTLSKPLGEDSERADRDVTIVGRDDHVLIVRTSMGVSRDGPVRGQEH